MVLQRTYSKVKTGIRTKFFHLFGGDLAFKNANDLSGLLFSLQKYNEYIKYDENIITKKVNKVILGKMIVR